MAEEKYEAVTVTFYSNDRYEKIAKEKGISVEQAILEEGFRNGVLVNCRYCGCITGSDDPHIEQCRREASY